MAKSKKQPRQCALCLKEKILCRSHILPNFFAAAIQERPRKPDGSHHYGPVNLVKGGMSPGILTHARGSWEHMVGVVCYLLCQECDADNFGRNETYVRSLLYGNSSPLTKKPVGISIKDRLRGEFHPQYKDVVCAKVDYSRFKLFHLSLLWRMAVSGGDIGKAVSLGKEHMEKLRAMLHAKQPGRWDEFPVSAVSLWSSERIEGICEPPLSRIKDGISFYRLIAGGYSWIWEVSDIPASDHSKKFALKEDGILVLPVTDIASFYPRWAKEIRRGMGEIF